MSRRELLIRASAIGVGLLLLAGLLEVVLRVHERMEPSYREFDPVLGFHYKPNTTVTVYSDESLQDIELAINAEGFRDIRHATEKPAGTRRVLILGDSFVSATQVNFEETFHRRLGRLLDARSPDISHEIINFGVSGYGTTQELVAFETLGTRYEPDVVILCFFMGNDVGNNSAVLSRHDGRVHIPRNADGSLAESAPLARDPMGDGVLASRSVLYRRVLEYVERINQKLDYYLFTRTLTHRYNVFYREPLPEWSEAWEITGLLLERLRDRVAAAGARLLLVSIPDAIQVYPDLWDHAMRRYDPAHEGLLDPVAPVRRLSAIATRLGIDHVNLYETFVAQREQSDASLYFGRSHLNLDGHRLTSEILAERLAP